MDELENEVQERPTFDEALQSLNERGEDRPGAHIIYGLSDIGGEAVAQLDATWKAIPASFRRKVLDELVNASEANFEFNYRQVGLYALTDPDARIRVRAIDLLWEDETLELLDHLKSLAINDESIDVRAAAASALGRFILLGEWEEIDETVSKSAQDVAVTIWSNESEDIMVRRRALEAISNSSHDIVSSAIQTAYHSPHQPMQVSAVFAMGKSCDPAWEEIVLKELKSSDPEIRYEAARAAGELEMLEAIPKLGQLILEEDREIVEVSVWSLGEIGSREAIRILDLVVQKAEDEDDDALLELAEDALGYAALAGGEIRGF